MWRQLRRWERPEGAVRVVIAWTFEPHFCNQGSEATVPRRAYIRIDGTCSSSQIRMRQRLSLACELNCWWNPVIHAWLSSQTELTTSITCSPTISSSSHCGAPWGFRGECWCTGSLSHHAGFFGERWPRTIATTPQHTSGVPARHQTIK